MKKKKLVKRITKLIIEKELERVDLDSQHSLAYHQGLIDGLDEALIAISPKAAKRFPISVTWFDEDMELERSREKSLELLEHSLFTSLEV